MSAQNRDERAITNTTRRPRRGSLARGGVKGIAIPLLERPWGSPTVFPASDLVEAVRRLRRLDDTPVPDVCILEFDGDLTDELAARGEAVRTANWPCFHTGMWRWESEGLSCGIVPRTIGGPFAVLVAEQLAVCGARVVIGLTSAGRVSPALPVPAAVVADRAVRDEGTSFHYLPPSSTVEAAGPLADALERTVAATGLPTLRGTVWTTDAPYRETAEQIAGYSASGVLAVEMQAASLFAFGRTSGLPVGLVAHVTNSSEKAATKEFEKGGHDGDRRLLAAACQAATEFLDNDERRASAVPSRATSERQMR